MKICLNYAFLTPKAFNAVWTLRESIWMSHEELMDFCFLIARLRKYPSSNEVST